MKTDYLSKLLFKGHLALKSGATGGALKYFSKVLAIDSSSAAAWLGLGLAQRGMGSYSEAICSFETVIRLQPRAIDGWFNLGLALVTEGRLKDAYSACGRACDLAPNSFEACHHMGFVCFVCGDMDRALHWLQKAVTLRDDNADAWHLMGQILAEQGLLDQAGRCIQKALQEEPTNKEFRNLLADIYIQSGRITQALQSRENVLKRHPTDGQTRSARLFSLGYDPNIAHEQLFKESLAWENYHAFGLPRCKIFPVNESDGRIRIGYVSADFYNCALGISIQAILQNHDRNRFEIFCYFNGNHSDTVTENIRSMCHAWQDVKYLNDEEAAHLIASDNLNLLVDLSGHSKKNRLGIFARKPAPIQMSYLGYAHTTGLSTMDYHITDTVSVPVTEERYYSERILHLPHFRICYVNPEVCPDVFPPPVIENKYITFGSFNSMDMMNEDVIRAWSTILKLVPDSRLILKWKTLRSTSVRQRYRRLFARYGISPKRIEMRYESSPYLTMLEYNDVDITLDPFPVSGCFTTFDSLWMGVPVITLPQLTPVSRQASAILRDCGLAELVVTSVDDYIDQAVKLASDHKYLQTLRGRIREMLSRSPLVDIPLFTKQLESIYSSVSGKLPLQRPVSNRLNIDKRLSLERVAIECYESGINDRAREILAAMGPLSRKSPFYKTLSATLVFENGRRHQAIESLYQLIDNNPDQYALFRLGALLKGVNQYQAARAIFERALELDPTHQVMRHNLAGCLIESGMIDEGIAHLEQLLKFSPKLDFKIGAYLFSINYSDQYTPRQIYEIHRDYADMIFSKGVKRYKKWTNSALPDRALKIGFVSGDFGMHPVSYFLVRAFEYHDSSQFEYYCYSNRSMNDSMTFYFRDHCHRWRNVWKMDANEIAKLIRKDRIDILVDLSGYTKDNRLDVFAFKPAPIQVSWLGYPNTTGLTAIDYRITDAVADPPGEADNLHTEKLIRLPGIFLCYYPPPEAISKLACPSVKNGYITFGSFNNLSKLTPTTIELWSAILRKVPQSKLLIKRNAFADDNVRSFFEERFARFGIGSERLILHPAFADANERVDINKQIGLYQEVDIALDPHPYNGTTTTCEALWMGVPVVTLKGDRHAARVGASILTEIGLQDLIAENEEEYIIKAVSLAENNNLRLILRQSLRGMISSSRLGDGAAYTRNLEIAFRSIWSDWCNKENC